MQLNFFEFCDKNNVERDWLIAQLAICLVASSITLWEQVSSPNRWCTCAPLGYGRDDSGSDGDDNDDDNPFYMSRVFLIFPSKPRNLIKYVVNNIIYISLRTAL